MTAPSPIDFFGKLVWLDRSPLLDHIEPYRRAIFEAALYERDDTGTPRYSMALLGRGKKNWKTADLVLAGLYTLIFSEAPQGADGFIVASDEGQADDDLKLAKRLLAVNPILRREVTIRRRAIERKDGGGTLMVLPSDVAGAHGKSYAFLGVDELHTARSWDLLEALAPDPTRPDALTWITSYASIYNSRGAPLHDLCQIGRLGTDPRMYFSWYSSNYTTDPDFADADPEARANPSMGSWPEGRAYLDQQRRRLPAHKFRRLHLNEPGLPDGAAFDPDAILSAIVPKRSALRPVSGVTYQAFVDMSGGSNDMAVLAIGHADEATGRRVVDTVVAGASSAPFNPRRAVKKFAKVMAKYGCARVYGDAYAGQTFRQDFEDAGVTYVTAGLTKHQLYEAFEAPLLAGEIELPDLPILTNQLLGLIWRGKKIDHQSSEHDDWANAVAGLVHVIGEGDGFSDFDASAFLSVPPSLATAALMQPGARIDDVDISVMDGGGFDTWADGVDGRDDFWSDYPMGGG